MPIRINLLAEQQAAEEMRRRDPVKRAFLAGIGLTLLMVLWIGLNQMKISRARADLANYQERLKKVEDEARLTRSNQLTMGIIDSHIRSLDRYSSNRFLWANVLDAVQHASVDSIRLVELRGDPTYHMGPAAKLFTTNIVLPYHPRPPFWKFWVSRTPPRPVEETVAKMFPTFTNKPPFTTNILDYSVKVTTASTNLIKQELTVKVEFTTVAWASEQMTVEMRGRGYGSPPGATIDEFARRIQNSEYFKEWLLPEKGFRFTERPPQPQRDQGDPVNPNYYVPFTIECKLKERVFTNE